MIPNILYERLNVAGFIEIRRFLKIKVNDIRGFFLNLIHNRLQNNGFAASSDARDNLNQIAVIESPDWF